MIAPPHSAAATTTVIHACSLVVTVQFEQYVPHEFMPTDNNIDYSNNVVPRHHVYNTNARNIYTFLISDDEHD